MNFSGNGNGAQLSSRPDAPTGATTFRVPEHVVYRSFAAETVVLDLETGRYYGLNATAGRMLELLEPGASAERVSAKIADEYDRPIAEVERDCLELCSQLVARGLLEVA